MHDKKSIPTFDFYKTLDPRLRFVFSQLEQSYNSYDASLPHRHNYYEILFFKGSGGLHEIDFNPYSIQENSLHFVSPEQVHLLRRDKNVTGYVISFTHEFFLEDNAGTSFIDGFPFFNNPYAMPVVKINESVQRQKIYDIIEDIRSEYTSENNDKTEALFSYLSVLLITARRMYIPENISGKPLAMRTELTHRFKKLVDSNFRKYKSVSEYARLLSITAGHLNDTVQKDIGKTASDIIYERIVLEAKRLLYHSPKSVKEIAADLMYDDPSYFTRFFKTHTQITPEEFRRQIREKYR
jgi:AraC-like DNA-binding protein